MTLQIRCHALKLPSILQSHELPALFAAGKLHGDVAVGLQQPVNAGAETDDGISFRATIPPVVFAG